MTATINQPSMSHGKWLDGKEKFKVYANYKGLRRCFQVVNAVCKDIRK